MTARHLWAFWTVLLLSVSNAYAIQPPQETRVEWQVDGMGILPSDKDAIIKLVRNLGLEPQRVSVETVLPLGNRILYVTSPIVVDGRHRVWRGVHVCRTDWRHCNNKEGPSLLQVGRWLARKDNVGQRETWRIEDGGWVKDVEVEPGVPFADAERIVLAIRHKRMVNRAPAVVNRLRAKVAPPDVNPENITWIRRAAVEPGTYEVTTGVAGGLILQVRIVGDTVELVGYSPYVV